MSFLRDFKMKQSNFVELFAWKRWGLRQKGMKIKLSCDVSFPGLFVSKIYHLTTPRIVLEKTVFY